MRSVSQFLTSTEVAERLRISEPTLARWRGADPVQGPPFVRVEGSIRYPSEALQRWIDERTLGGALPT